MHHDGAVMRVMRVVRVMRETDSPTLETRPSVATHTPMYATLFFTSTLANLRVMREPGPPTMMTRPSVVSDLLMLTASLRCTPTALLPPSAPPWMRSLPVAACALGGGARHRGSAGGAARLGCAAAAPPPPAKAEE